MVALIGAGCSDEPDENGNAGNTKAGEEQAVKFAQCIATTASASSRTRTRRAG
jgi:hypothetical protein